MSKTKTKTPRIPRTPTMSSPSTNTWPLTNNNFIGTSSSIDYHSTRYSMDGKILLAAVLSLFFVVALVFLLHLYIRHLLRRSRHLPHRHSTTSRRIFVVTSQAAQPSSSGLAPSALAAIPTFQYRKKGGDEPLTECAVCLSAVEEGEEVRLLPNCKHVFHVGCIDMWLQSHCTCPVCRAGVEPPSKAEEVVRLPMTAGASLGPKEGSSSSTSSSRMGASFRRMLSGREWSGRRPAHGDGLVEDVERQ